MQYSNFDMKNNVHATLSTAVSSVATTIQLTSWQWSRFWTTFPQIATLESFDENWKVIKREIVKITWRSGDNLTVVRAFAPCPSNDDANSQSQNAISFNPDDQISLYIPKEIFDKIADSLNDIYDNWTNNLRTENVSWLVVEVNAWPVLVWSSYYDFAGWTITLTDNATNYLEIDENWNLANNTTDWNEENTKLAIITTSGGSVTNIKDRRLWTVWWKIGWLNIHELTEKENINPDDEFVIADSENIFQNKKVKAKNILWYQDAICSDWINIGDVVSVFDNSFNPTWNIDVWKTNNKIWIEIYWNWIQSDTLYLFLWNAWNWQDLWIRIETDDNWLPSWTLVDNNATQTILASNLTTTLTKTPIVFGDQILLERLTKYRVVISWTSIDASNYWIIWTASDISYTNIKTNDWSNRNDIVKTETATNSVSWWWWSGLAYSFTLYLTPNTNFKLKKISWYWQGTVNISGGDVSYSGNWTNINLNLLAGTQYTLQFPISQSYVNYSASVSVTSSFYTMSAWRANSWSITIEIELATVKRCSIASDLFYLNYCQKIDNSLPWTITDIVWISMWSWNTWQKVNIWIKNWIASNSNWNLTPWQEYFYINNSISGSPEYHKTKIFLWIAIDSTHIKLDPKIYYYFWPWFDFYVPFTWTLIAQNNSNSWWNIKIDWWSAIQTIIDKICKWQRLQNDWSYYRALTKDR